MVNNSVIHGGEVSRSFLVSRSREIRLLGLLAVLMVPLLQAFHFGSRILDWLPVWSWYADPGYQYLLNGAVIVNGGVPGHTDHPGTSTQWLIGLIEQITFWVSGSESSIFVDLVYSPEKYAQVVSWVFLGLYIGALLFLGIRMWREFGTAVAITTQLMLVWSVSLLGSGVFKLVPETVVLLAFLTLVALLVSRLKRPRGDTSTWLIIAIGVVSAIGITSKVIFLPALLLPIILLKIKDLVIAFVVFLGATMLIMIPTIPRMNQMWDWYSGVLLNSGRHGGEVERSVLENLLNASEGITGIVRWWSLVFISFLILSIVLYVVPTFRKKIGPGVLSLGALILTSFGIVAMGYKQSETRDFVLLGVTVAMLAGILLWLYKEIVPSREGLILSTVVVAVSAFFAAHGIVGSTYGYPLITERSAERVDSGRQINELAKRGVVAQSYDSWTEAGALSFAEDWTNGEFAQAIAERFPDTYEYSIWDQRIYTWNSGNGRDALDCLQIVDLLSDSELFIVVPGVGTLDIDPTMREINSPDGTIVVSQLNAIGPNPVFQVVEIRCANSGQVGATS